MMKISVKKWLACDVGILVLVLGLTACDRMLAKDAFAALQIKQAQVLEGTCTVPAEPTAAHRSRGTLDIDLPDLKFPPYVLPVSVANNLAALGASPAEEMNNITLTHFTIELSADGVSWDDSCPKTFDTQKFTFTIEPGGATGAHFSALTSAHSRCLYPYIPAGSLTVTAKIWAKGRHGGTSIESAPFVFPIDVCKGCLQQGYTQPELVVYNYPADYPVCSSVKGVNPYIGDDCFAPGQDKPILCCSVQTAVGGATQNIPVCPGFFTGDSTSTATDTSTSP